MGLRRFQPTAACDMIHLWHRHARESLARQPAKRKKIAGFAPEQRFFLSLSQIWRVNCREAEMRRLITVDPHSPGHDRVNGVLSNMPEFQKAFACKVGQPMVREKACKVW